MRRSVSCQDPLCLIANQANRHPTTVQEEEAPKGFLANGHYKVTSTFVDDDKKTHLKFEWTFDIVDEKNR